MATRHSGQTSIFGGVFFVSKSLSRVVRQKKIKQFTILTRKPRSHVRILIDQTWPIPSYWLFPEGSFPSAAAIFLSPDTIEKNGSSNLSA